MNESTTAPARSSNHYARTNLVIQPGRKEEHQRRTGRAAGQGEDDRYVWEVDRHQTAVSEPGGGGGFSAQPLEPLPGK